MVVGRGGGGGQGWWAGVGRSRQEWEERRGEQMVSATTCSMTTLQRRSTWDSSQRGVPCEATEWVRYRDEWGVSVSGRAGGRGRERSVAG